MSVLLAAIVAFVVAMVVTRTAELVSRRSQVLDVPNARSSHSVPTPRTGGLGIMSGVCAGWVVMGGWHDETTVIVLAAALTLGGMGLLDDLSPLSPALKYVAQLGAAVAVAMVLTPDLRLTVPGLSIMVSGIPALVVVAIWLTAVVNAFNFMDGIDGLVGSVAVIIALVGTAWTAPTAAALLALTAGASVGFLVWNTAPASVFMGDSGSHFLGLLVGALLLVPGSASVEVVPILIVLAPLLADTGWTLVRRARRRERLFAAHREHLYQRFVIAGASHRSVAAAYTLSTAALGLLAIWPSAAAAAIHLAALAAVAIGVVFASHRLGGAGPPPP